MRQGERTNRRRVVPALAISALWMLLVGAGMLVTASPSAQLLDERAAAVILDLSPPWTVLPTRILDLLFASAGMAGLLSLIALLATMSSRRILDGARLLATGLIPWGLEGLAKQIVGRPRPAALAEGADILPLPSSPSFPSGHTACAVICAVLAVSLLRTTRARAVAGALGVAISVTTAWARVRAGVHLPGDVIASLLIMPPMTLCCVSLFAPLPGAGPATSAAPSAIGDGGSGESGLLHG